MQPYIPVILSILAIVGTYVALVVAQFFHDNRKAKIALVAAATFCAAGAIAATIYNRHLIVITPTTDATRHVMVREGLGKFIEEGKKLKGECEDASVPLPNDAASDWDNRVAAFLGANLGASYVTRFRDPTGALPPFMGGPAERRSLWLGMYVRLFRMEQFSHELLL
jgi:hypothetical protein